MTNRCRRAPAPESSPIEVAGGIVTPLSGGESKPGHEHRHGDDNPAERLVKSFQNTVKSRHVTSRRVGVKIEVEANSSPDLS